jgi:ABC-2 type transport system permease protein
LPGPIALLSLLRSCARTCGQSQIESIEKIEQIKNMSRSRRSQALLQFGLFCGILLFVNIIAGTFHARLDLTEERRFTLTAPTRSLLRELKDRIYISVLLGDDYPAEFKRLPEGVRDLLDDFRAESGLIDYNFEDPMAGGNKQEINERVKALAEAGVYPTDLGFRETGQKLRKKAYPVAIVHYGSRKVPVNLIENNAPVLDPDPAMINNSIQKLEYKLANAIKKIQAPERQNILFTAGHGELNRLQTTDLERSLRQFYNTDRIVLDSALQLNPDKCALLVVAKPRGAFSEKDKFKIDQYVMQGGSVLWMIDRLNADLDSINRYGRFIPRDYPLNLEDILFKYGVRIQPDLLMDLECTKIPIKTGELNGQPQFQPFPWYYHPAVLPTGRHAIVKNLDRVELRFCSSIDTIRTKTNIVKTPLIRSSRYSTLQFSPVDLNFEILRYEPDPAKFNKGGQTVGVLLEGAFPSNYENRVSAEMMAGLQQLGIGYKSIGEPARMMVISDGDVAANSAREADKSWFPLGFNRFENFQYANKDLLLNAIEYLIEPDGVVEARSREVKLRLLDAVRAKNEKARWQALNLGLPLVFLLIFAFLFTRRRKKKYATA